MTGRALITGAAGFIGSHIADRLLDDGWAVCGVDNLLTGRKDNYPGELVNGCVSDVGLLEALVRRNQPSVIVHCAASYHEPDRYDRDMLTNAVGTANVVALAAEWRCRIVYFQTALCYGHHPGTKAPIGLGWPINPDNSYAISKTAGESYLLASDVDFVSLRLANVYGPRNVSGPIPTFYKRLAAGQPCVVVNSRRDYVHIDDLLDVAVPAIAGKGSGVYHVASGGDVAIGDTYDTVCRVSGLTGEVEYRDPQPGDAESILLDPSRTEREFGWKPRVSLADGVASAVAWYERHGVDRTFTHLQLQEAA